MLLFFGGEETILLAAFSQTREHRRDYDVRPGSLTILFFFFFQLDIERRQNLIAPDTDPPPDSLLDAN